MNRRLGALLIGAMGATLVHPSEARAQERREPDEAAESRDGDAFSAWYLTGGIVSATGGMAMGVLGIWATLKLDAVDDDPRFRRFAEGVPASSDPCEAADLGVPNKDYRLLDGAMLPSEASAKCADRDELIAIQIVSFPSAVVFSGLGAFLISEAFGEGADDLKLMTHIGPGSFGATVGMSF